VTYRIVLTTAARADLREISNHRRIAGDPIAHALSEKIIAAAASLSERPTRQRLRNDLSPRLRALSVGNYMIFYRVQQDAVAVVRILHGSRNITPQFFHPIDD
jgi:toxin ParE1/3/4